jgi:hypothetical protein
MGLVSVDRPRRDSDDDKIISYASHHYNIRRARDRVFASDQFSDHGWDILLLLCINMRSSAGLSLDHLSSALRASRATLDRFVKVLVADDLVEKTVGGVEPDADTIMLSNRGLTSMRIALSICLP